MKKTSCCADIYEEIIRISGTSSCSTATDYSKELNGFRRNCVRKHGFSASHGSSSEEGREGERGREREEAGISENASVLQRVVEYST